MKHGTTSSGSGTLSRVVAGLLLIASLLLIAAYALLPPVPFAPSQWRWNEIQGFPTLVPFRTIGAYLAYGLVDVERRQLLGNVVLFMPFGFALPLAVRASRSLIRTFVAVVCLAFAVETLQMILPAHGADIDDVILNSFGALLGFLCYQLTSITWRLVRRTR